MAGKNQNKNQGYAILLSILIVGAVGAAIAISSSLSGFISYRTSSILEQSGQARALADACTEEALQQIKDSVAFSGSGSLLLEEGSCSYTVTKLTGQNRTINATGMVGTVVRKVRVTIDKINPSINVTSWREVGDF